MKEKKVVVGQRVSWKRVFWFIGLTYIVSFMLCGFVYIQGKKLDPEKPPIKLYTDISQKKPAAVARYLEMHPEVGEEDLPTTVPGVGGVLELETMEERVAVYVSQKHLPIQAFGIMMIFPALIAIILRFVFRDGFRNTGFRFGKAANYFWALGFIVAFTFLSILVNALIFGQAPDWQLEEMGMKNLVLVGKPVPPFLFWIFQFLIIGVIANLTFPIIMMLGEEYGWRSYLLQNLLPLGFWRANIITGIVWGLWHAPVILMGYNYGYYNIIGVFLFVLVCILIGTIFNYMYIRGNSVILTSAAHGWFNGMVPSIILLTGYMGKETILAPLGIIGIMILLTLVVVAAKLTNNFDISPYIERKKIEK